MGKREKPEGECLLLGTRGKFAKSHIIPKFLTNRALGRAARIQFGINGYPQLLFDSWWDETIVGEEGERRLRDIDTAAAQIFRSLGISWSNFPLSPHAVRAQMGDSEFELISIPDCDTETLRLFFLSLLWRSAVSSRLEFAGITLDQESLETLRRCVLGIEQPSTADFPCVLLLLTTRGEPQIFTPATEIIDMEQLGFTLPNIPIFRFFLDGLIVHMGRKLGDVELAESWGRRIVGSSRDLFLLGRPYEGSAQEENIETLKEALFRDYPEQAAKIYRTLDRHVQRGK